MTARAIVMADGDGVIRGWSGGAEALFGHAASDAIGKTLDLIVPETHRDQHWRGFRAAISRGRSDDDNVASVPVRTRDGSISRFAVRILVLADAFGGGAGAVAVFAPLPEGRSALAEL
jgi:PAS domain S-box-containing protein